MLTKTYWIQTSYLTLTCPFKFVKLHGNDDDEEYDIDEQFYADSVSQVCWKNCREMIDIKIVWPLMLLYMCTDKC